MEAAAVVLSILTFVNTSFDIAKKYHRAVTNDNRFKTLYWNFLAERKITNGWANNMRLNPGGIPSEEANTVDEIRCSLEASYKKVDKRMNTYQPSDTGKVTSPSARIKWLTGGYEDLRDLLGLIRALNQALRTIAPPLPQYSDTNPSYRPPPPVPSREEVVDNQDLPAELPQPHEDTTLRQLYMVCLQNLSQMIASARSLGDELGRVEDRLRVWGDGLIHDELPLDALLHESNAYMHQIRIFLLSAFVDLAFTQGVSPFLSTLLQANCPTEQILQRWTADVQRSDLGRLESSKNQLSAALAGEKVTHLTLQKWQVTLVEDEQDGPKTDEKDVKFISDVVDLLFSLLPAIRGIRWERILKDEANKAAKSKLELGESSGEAVIDTEDLIRENLESVRKIEDAVRKQESSTRHSGSTVPLYSATITKIINRLDEWRLNAVDDNDVATRAKTSEVQKVQEQLALELSEWHACL